VTVEQDSGSLALHGELDLATGPILADALRVLQALDPARITVDLAELTFLDAAGLGQLVGCRNALSARGAELWVTNASSRVRRIVDICGLGALLAGVDHLVDRSCERGPCPTDGPRLGGRAGVHARSAVPDDR
jgi:anti-sigma B factor antagonist